MKVLVTGAGGQLAWELERLFSSKLDGTEKVTPWYASRTDVDITDRQALEKAFAEFQPDAVINAAAYTAVDKAEEDVVRATEVNALGVQHLASLCKANGVYLLHISTDFVFDGNASVPYAVDAPRKPAGAYGKSKAEGEVAIATTMENDWAIIRTAWVYSSHGNNFVKTMLRLMSEKPALGIVADQVGTPTWVKSLADVCWSALQNRIQGIYHWTDAGVASWYDFAVAIQELGVQKGLLKAAIPVNPIRTHEYPVPAKRPAYSVLDKTEILKALPSVQQNHWRSQLSLMLDDLQK